MICILNVKELTSGIMKSGVKMEHPPGRIITANGGVTFLVSVYLGCLCSVVLFCITAMK